MKYIFILISLIFLISCSPKLNTKNETSFNIDIYENDMTYEKFKKIVIDYAENAPFPQLIDND